MQERTTVRLPQELLLRAKRKAASQGRTLTSLIEDGLRLVVADEVKPPRAERVMPPVSKATGGLLPGVRLEDVQEIEDMEYVERLKRGFE